MTNRDVIPGLLRALNEVGCAYMVVGSVSTNVYCAPRATQDADVVVEGSLGGIGRAVEALASEFRLDPQLGFERVTLTKKVVLYHREYDFCVEIFALSDDPHDQERFARRRQVLYDDIPMWVAAAEDVVITKLRWSLIAGREKDVSDVRNVLALRQQTLDMDYIRRWCAEHETLELLEKFLRQVGP
jgi:hypothetical protein